jgi:O-antigen ligase
MRANKSSIFKWLYLSCSLLIAVTMVFPFLINSFFIIVLVLIWLVEGDFKRKLQSFRSNKLAMLFSGFFLVFLIGLIYTENKVTGYHVLERKLSILVFPIIFSTISLDGKTVIRILKVFAFFTVLAGLLCLFNATWKYLLQNTTEYFYYHNFSSFINIHAVYFSYYQVFALIIFTYLLFCKEYVNRMLKLVYLLCISLNILFIFILASKFVILFTILLACVGYLYFLIFTRRVVLASLLFTVFAVSSVILISLKGEERFREVFSTDFSTLDLERVDPATSFNGYTLRIIIWKACISILGQENWITGVGTGDGQQHLDKFYVENHFYLGEPGGSDKGFLGYNTHSQYMEILLCNGASGLSYFLILIVWALRNAMKDKNYICLAFLVLFASSCLTETVLGLQKGAVLFGFFGSLLLFQGNEIKKTLLDLQFGIKR